MGCFPERLRISPDVCGGNDPSCLLLQMEEKRRKYSISSENSDTTDSKALPPKALEGQPIRNTGIPKDLVGGG